VKHNTMSRMVLYAFSWLILTVVIFIQFILFRIWLLSNSYQSLLVIWICITLILVAINYFVFRNTGRFLAILVSILLVATILTRWGILWQLSILPKNVTIKFEILSNQGNVEYEQNVTVIVFPNAENVYFLIHPHSTELWYVQSEPTSVKRGAQEYWTAKILFGDSPPKDCGKKFDVVVLASRDDERYDIFRGRILQPGDQIDYLPVLNQSEIITVTKQCEED